MKSGFSLFVRLAATLVWGSVLTAAAAELPRAEPVPGGVAIVTLAPTSTPRPRAYFDGGRVMVVEHDGQWRAVVGLPLSLEPGEHILVVDSAGHRQTRPFTVHPKTYATQQLVLTDRRLVEPRPDDLARIRADLAAIQAAFATWTETLTPPPLRFTLPVRGRLSSPFGLRRYFNGQPRQPHSGIDIAAPRGTPILAPAEGEVIATGDFFFNGRSVFLDHGLGLVTMYNHLERIYVQPGERVSRGQPIGEIGTSGRVTGPHLHWTVSLNNARVDPMLFLEEAAAAALLEPAGTPEAKAVPAPTP